MCKIVNFARKKGGWSFPKVNGFVASRDYIYYLATVGWNWCPFANTFLFIEDISKEIPHF